MGLITKKDAIQNMASLEEYEPEEEDAQKFAYDAQEGGLLDEVELRSDDSD